MRPKKLNELLKDNPFVNGTFEPIEIYEVCANSSTCQAGSLFVATSGATPTSKDGHDFIDEAIKNGAQAVIFEHEKVLFKNYPVTMIKASDSKACLAHLCEEFYDRPSSKVKVIGITGTNGKTSTSFMLHSILKEADFTPKIMGTLGMGDPDNLEALTHTTMDPKFISQALAQMNKDGVSHLVMEVSSHALSLKRVEALNFSVVALTNITQDHLDFHGNLEEYTKAKARLFYELAHEKTAMVLPTDHPFSIPKHLSPIMVGEKIDQSEDGKTFTLKRDQGVIKITLPFSGDFHVKNASLAAAIAQSLDIKDEHIVAGLRKTLPIPGRLQWIDNHHDFQVVVDFAHTPDALNNLLTTIKKVAKAKIILVFGCGGDRDQKKRPIMGEIAEKFATFIIVTDDNPRTEDPQVIRQDILSGIKTRAQEIGDRRLAIKTAISMAQKNDIVVIAGKGHENYQIYQTTKTAFSDQLEAQKALDEL